MTSAQYILCAIADVYGFFYHAIPETGALTLSELHAVVRDVWLTRHDEDLEAERAARRPGRPKSAREVRLEDQQFREAEEYRTGLGTFPLSNILPFPGSRLTNIPDNRQRS